MQAKIKKIIKVSPESCKKLGTLHNCSKQSVYAALAVAIRRDALKVFGGVETDKVVFN